MIKFKTYTGGILQGYWLLTVKLDGVCAIVEGGKATSKSGKPLYNFEDIPKGVSGIFEVYDEDWNTSVSLCRNRSSGKRIRLDQLYQTVPPCDVLRKMNLLDPPESLLMEHLTDVLWAGYEGLVMWPIDPNGNIDTSTRKPVKIKPSVTVDIRVVDLKEGKGKYKGMLGAFVTKYGKISGMDDETRAAVWKDKEKYLLGIIEVEAMGWTRGNKLRHPRFKRFRWDKQEENLER